MSQDSCVSDVIVTLFKIITPNAAGQTFMIAGFVLILVSVLVAWHIAKDGTFPVPMRWMFFSSLLVGLVLLAGGPLSILLPLSSGVIPVVPPEKSFANLEENARVTWLIRLIPYESEDAGRLAVGNLKDLGPADQKFTFAASYHELRGYSVEQAVRMTGGGYHPGQRVTAIIFRVDGQLLPANAKGLLQAVRMVQQEMEEGGTANRLTLSERDLQALAYDAGEGLVRWSWEGYGKDYPSLCLRATEFRCGDYGEKRFMGAIADDWNPLGFANREPSVSRPCGPERDKVCNIHEWSEATEQHLGHFGARVFLVRNRPIATLKNAYLIDFEDPEQVIPDIGAAEPN